MPSALVPIRGRPLFVEITGEGPPLVALHGLGGSTSLFPLADDFAQRGFTVIRFDFEGAGKSPLASDHFELDDFVEDVRAVLEYAGFATDGREEKAVIFGHSLGAAVGLHFAAKFPDRLSHLVLSCPGVARAGNPEAVKMSLALAQTAREKGPIEMADFTATKNTRPGSSRVERTLIRAAMQESSPEGYALMCEMISRTGSPDWSRIGVLVLIIAGKEDQISSVEAAETIKGCLTSAKSVEVVAVEAGHQPAVECPDVVVDLLCNFLA